MAIDTALPAPAISWIYRVQYPGPYGNRRTRENFRSPADQARVVGVGAKLGGSNPVEADVTAVGQGDQSSTGGDLYDIKNGVPCSRMTTGPDAFGWSVPWWTPVLDGSLLDAGWRPPEGAAVAVIDADYYWGRPGGSDTADDSGVWIGGALDSSSSALYRNQMPSGLSPGADTGGAGVFVRTDGTGYDYISWTAADVNFPGGIITERIPIITTVADAWHTIRFILVTALPGGAAQLTVQFGGVEIVSRLYGSAELTFPWARSTGFSGKPVSPAVVFAGGPGSAGFDWAYRWGGKWGRFLPSGVEVVGE